mmetsp:Transcript_125814/g.355748  ORF Transcript_125814/g.355748 Transcript_125814/m.355748 type:complete len:206 (+) Transcript_125814:227-844(+)
MQQDCQPRQASDGAAGAEPVQVHRGEQLLDEPRLVGRRDLPQALLRLLPEACLVHAQGYRSSTLERPGVPLALVELLPHLRLHGLHHLVGARGDGPRSPRGGEGEAVPDGAELLVGQLAELGLGRRRHRALRGHEPPLQGAEVLAVAQCLAAPHRRGHRHSLDQGRQNLLPLLRPGGAPGDPQAENEPLSLLWRRRRGQGVSQDA